MSTSRTPIADLRKAIQEKRQELHALETEYMKIQEGALSHRKKSTSKDVDRDDRISFILLILTSIGMGIFVLSGWFMNPDQTKSSKAWSLPWSIFTKETCKANDGNYTACVAGQQAGNGCVWYADCNKCVRHDTPNIASVCNK